LKTHLGLKINYTINKIISRNKNKNYGEKNSHGIIGPDNDGFFRERPDDGSKK